MFQLPLEWQLLPVLVKACHWHLLHNVYLNILHQYGTVKRREVVHFLDDAQILLFQNTELHILYHLLLLL